MLRTLKYFSLVGLGQTLLAVYAGYTFIVYCPCKTVPIYCTSLSASIDVTAQGIISLFPLSNICECLIQIIKVLKVTYSY